MQTIVSGKGIDVGDAVRQYAEEHLWPCIQKYFDRAVRSHVTLSKNRHMFCCDIVVNDGTGLKHSVTAHAEGADVYAAFGLCVQKVEKQLRRYKKKLNALKRRGGLEKEPGVMSARQFILSGDDGDETESDSVISHVDEEDVAYASFESPAIIAEGVAEIEELSVGEAVMKMDLQELHALMFINSKNGHVSVVHRRPDGHVSWVDSHICARAGAEGAALRAEAEGAALRAAAGA